MCKSSYFAGKMVLIQSISYSFVNCDMFMRHFGHGIGHMQCERQHEVQPDIMAVKDLSKSDSSDGVDTGDSDPGELEIGQNHDSDEKESDASVERSNDEGGDWGSEGDVSEISNDTDGGDWDGYTSY
jgi:hypothetical protein